MPFGDVPMKPGIEFFKKWSDEDMVEFQIDTSDGESLFSNRVYIGHYAFGRLIDDISQFRLAVNGGIFDMRFGEFGPEFGSGAFHARLHFRIPTKLYITVRAESDFKEFGIKSVASEATLYLISEPVLLDNFLFELKQVKAGAKTQATLKAIAR